MSDVFDDIVGRHTSPADAARVAAIVASDFRLHISGRLRSLKPHSLLDSDSEDYVPETVYFLTRNPK